MSTPTNMLTRNKKTKDDLFDYLAKLERKIDNIELQNTRIQESLVEFEDKIATDIETFLADLGGVKERVIALETAMAKMKEQNLNADEFKSLKTEIKELKIKCLKQENAVVACDLRINGIPYDKNENLNAIFNQLSSVINAPTPTLKSIYRLQNRNNTKKLNSPDGIIIAKFRSPYDKNFFLKNLSKFKKSTKSNLTLNHIGQQSNNPIYINENLSNTNYKILQEAVRLKKTKNITSAYTFRGLVYIKHNSSDQPRCIEHVDVLKQFFRESANESASASPSDS